MQNKRNQGALYERYAAEYLERQGLEILEENYRCRMGEVDLIARDGSCLVFIEVKYRSGRTDGFAAEAVNLRKQKVIGKVAAYYLMPPFATVDVPCRFDVVAFDGKTMHWYRNAFSYSE